MSDAPVPNDAESTPSADELDDVAIPASLRRAPRLGRIIGSGVGGGALLGIILGLTLPNSTGVGRGMVAVLVGLGFALIGGMVAGAIATRLDGRDPKAMPRQPRRARKAAQAHSRSTADEDTD